MKTWQKIVVIILLLGIGVFALFYFFNKITVPTPVEDGESVLFPGFEKNDGTQGGAGGETVSETKKITLSKISDVTAFDFWISKDTGEIYYITDEGRIFSGKDGEDVNLNTQQLNALNSISPSTSGKKILASFGDPQKPRWGIFDVVDGVWKPLSEEITLLAWGKDEDTLVGVVESEKNYNLSSFDLSKNPIKATVIIKDFRMKDVSFVWKNPDSLFILERPSASIKGRLWEFNTKTAILKRIDPGTSGLTVLWNAARDHALRFANPNNLLVTNGSLEPLSPLTITTLPQKCGFGAQTLYCFTPQNEEQFLGYSLPDDYLQNKFYSTDTLVSINLSTDESETLFETGTGEFIPIDGWHPQENASSIFFVNKYDRFVYRADISSTENTPKQNEPSQEINQENNEPSPFN